MRGSTPASASPAVLKPLLDYLGKGPGPSLLAPPPAFYPLLILLRIFPARPFPAPRLPALPFLDLLPYLVRVLDDLKDLHGLPRPDNGLVQIPRDRQGFKSQPGLHI